MGWGMLLLLGIGAAAALTFAGMPRRIWTLAGAALMLGAAGYAWQGSPMLAASPVAAEATKLPVDPGYKALREALYGRFGGQAAYFAISDAALRQGDVALAARVLTGAIEYAPRDPSFWSELGTVTALHDGNRVSPASLFAFQQAMRLAPRHPGPPFFLGLAYVRSGEFARARPYWARAVALAPATAEYRSGLVERLALLDAFLADLAAQPRR